jgi:hypothetical protein
MLFAKNALVHEELTGHRLACAAVVAAVRRRCAKSDQLFGFLDLKGGDRGCALCLFLRFCREAGCPLSGVLGGETLFLFHQNDVAPHDARVGGQMELKNVAGEESVALARAAAALVESVVLWKRGHRVPAVHPEPLAVLALPEVALVPHPEGAAVAGKSGRVILLLFAGVGPEAPADNLLLDVVQVHLLSGDGDGGRGG